MALAAVLICVVEWKENCSARVRVLKLRIPGRVLVTKGLVLKSKLLLTT